MKKLNVMDSIRKQELFIESKKIINTPLSQGILHRLLLALELRELGVNAEEFRRWYENEQI